ncbi:hypothetical protein D1632_07045 [Chryseobacterium nematophagum]|uniref:Carboxypeptidase regulatory-like domain-containing protein n=1 Tax=Chryseobacterium nematophagum TaxID=2305228 RepID=A0A3M7LCZ5_9FLAO|nr:hypothetical protein [Chryseobacterium nematophagum]RMZ59392.1 hypothetical protein D1632_07045 [Chryseobacterium nematophagum]
MKIIVGFVIFFIIFGCTKKNDLENQITIKINTIDSKTKQPRINTFDTIDVRKEKRGYLTKTYAKVGEYITDSMGSVKIKIDYNEGYKFLLKKKGFYGSESFAEPYTNEKLKDGQEVNIDVFSIKKE